MSDTLPDVKLLGVEYQDLYDATGITPTTHIAIQNKRSVAVYIQVAPNKPSSTSTDGYLLLPNKVCIVVGTISRVWAMGRSTVSVQIVEDNN